MEKALCAQNDDLAEDRQTIKRWYYRGKRWLYRGQRPDWIAKLLNKLWAIVATHTTAPHGLVALEVVGRKSGKAITVPADL